jgi:Lytic transglycolase
MSVKVRGATAVLVAVGVATLASASPAAAVPAGRSGGGRYLNLRVELVQARAAAAAGGMGSFVLTLVAVPVPVWGPLDGRAAHLVAIDRSLFAAPSGPLVRRMLPAGRRPNPGRGDRTVQGRASWYRWEGCGAGRLGGHGDLPVGTRVRVTNLDNGRSVTVRIEDRGSLVSGRLLDLCPAAFAVLAPLGRGVVRVRISWVRPSRRS